MSYSVFIRCNATGEVREHKLDMDWDEASEFWWTEGNMGCDCNRAMEFARAGGPGPPDDPHWNNLDRECGETAFTISHALLPDGTRIELDEPDQPSGANE